MKFGDIWWRAAFIATNAVSLLLTAGTFFVLRQYSGEAKPRVLRIIGEYNPCLGAIPVLMILNVAWFLLSVTGFVAVFLAGRKRKMSKLIFLTYMSLIILICLFFVAFRTGSYNAVDACAKNMTAQFENHGWSNGTLNDWNKDLAKTFEQCDLHVYNDTNQPLTSTEKPADLRPCAESIYRELTLTRLDWTFLPYTVMPTLLLTCSIAFAWVAVKKLKKAKEYDPLAFEADGGGD